MLNRFVSDPLGSLDELANIKEYRGQFEAAGQKPTKEVLSCHAKTIQYLIPGPPVTCHDNNSNTSQTFHDNKCYRK